MKVKRKIYKMFKALVIAISFACTIIDVPVLAEDARIVRVGCVDIDNFLTVMEDGHAEGYGAEYLENIARNTGWKYEYIEGTWEDCLKWLKDGKIDLLLPAEYSEERAQDYLYSEEECCMDYAALICQKGNDNLYYDDPQSYNGLKIGLITGNYLNKLFEDYAKKHKLEVERRYYPDSEALDEAVVSKEVDAMVSGNMQLREKDKLLARFGYMPAYFITSAGNPSLMDELNTALKQIKLYNPYYTANLQEKYYGDIEGQSAEFTKEEMEYIQAHPKIKVIFDKDNYPLAWYDKEEKRYKGLFPSFIELMGKECGVQFVPVLSKTEDAWDIAAENGNALLVNSYHDYSLGKKYGLAFSREYYNLPFELLAKKGTSFSLEGRIKVAVTGSREQIQAFAGRTFPDWDIVWCGTDGECMKKVANGDADAAFLNSYALQEKEHPVQYKELVSIPAAASSLPVCLGIPQGEPDILRRILDKTILRLDETDVQNCIIHTVVESESKITAKKLITLYPEVSIPAICGTTLLILFLVLQFHYNKVQKKHNTELEEKNIQLERAAEREKKLRRMAEIDGLTAVLNKAALENTCNYCIAEKKIPGILLVMDIDWFKMINDTHGHLFGDDVLKVFGGILLELFSGADAVSGRVGGDEFAVYWKGMHTPDEVRELCGKIKLKLSEAYKGISCSIGSAMNPEDGLSYKELFAVADARLYQAKEEKK